MNPETETIAQAEERLLEPTVAAGEQTLDLTLRPKRLAEFVGQAKLRENLDIFLEAARRRGEPLEHVLFYGPPGLGKTTLAHIIAEEMGVHCRITSGPALERVGDIASILTNLEKGDVLFIDEIHRLNRTIEEVLYPAMEDFALDIVIGKGPSARTVRLDLPRFTLVGATTRLSLLSSPLRDRFGATYHLDFYAPEELSKIIRRSALLLGIQLPDEVADLIALRSRGTPRIANRLLRRVRDFAEVRNNNCLDLLATEAALGMLEIDRHGLDATDRRLLEAVIIKFGGGPVGLQTLAAATSEEMETIETVHEPFLLQLGFLARTPRGRVATDNAYDHLGLPRPERVIE
ncbi:Holliday junction DNA helicase RuvB [Candidatus Uhrbacteria bacterium RIFCSPHIGHO2_02_FULL_60_10]|uniref:Holliday junction branch migration complex subunit RuvB n=1 Tax=Candidatus Uhrbacteria bacterium RIFCSPHIGHO2_02_FULL_60_10 TaxID=1802392 RepID=A0A1F7U6F3_9BACT|nr:MAG: Holliday junction DNA helicase RuvB [Candidatus Uhrbacteria bacterium RIFCSPHIGHO2_02_FULL_60_10]